MSHESQPLLTTKSAVMLAIVIIATTLILVFTGPKIANSPTTPEVDTTIIDTLTELNLDPAAIAACASTPEANDVVAADELSAELIGATSTPYVVMMNTETGQVFPVRGFLEYDAMNFLVDTMLGTGEESLPEVTGFPTEAVVPLNETDHVRGNRDATLVMIEYADLDCTYCRQLHPTMERLVAENPNDVAWAFRHLPLTTVHPDARNKALAAECVAQQTDEETFWEFIDLIMHNKS